MYGWLGQISVFGFLTAYALLAGLSTLRHRKALGSIPHLITAHQLVHSSGNDCLRIW